MARVNRGWSTAAVAMALGGCATGGATATTDLAVRTSLECAPERFPELLPSADLLVDTAALTADLRVLPEAFDTALVHDHRFALTMAYQEDGINLRRDILAHDSEPVVADSVQKLVFAHRRQLPEAEQEWGVRLVIDLGEDMAYRVERREYCPPQPRSREIESAMSTYQGTGLRYRSGARVRSVVMRVMVHPAGYVAGGTIVRGGTTGSPMEQELLTYIRQFSFEPATVDGIPTYGRLDIPIQIRG
jgi:hypothetical protein